MKEYKNPLILVFPVIFKDKCSEIFGQKYSNNVQLSKLPQMKFNIRRKLFKYSFIHWSQHHDLIDTFVESCSFYIRVYWFKWKETLPTGTCISFHSNIAMKRYTRHKNEQFWEILILLEPKSFIQNCFSFVSLRSGEQIQNIKFGAEVADICVNKRVVCIAFR